VQEQVELGRHELARLPELVEQGAGAEAAVAGQAGGDPVEVAVLRRQDVRLLVVEVLDRCSTRRSRCRRRRAARRWPAS
jgi:hypothetical protein